MRVKAVKAAKARPNRSAAAVTARSPSSKTLARENSMEAVNNCDTVLL